MIKKMKDVFTDSFNTKRFFLIFGFIILLFVTLVIINFTRLTLSKYASTTNVNVSPDLAFFITDVGTYENSIELDKILPTNKPYLYTFTVSNNKDNQRINVNLEYEIEFIATTNLPLTFKLYKNSSTSNDIITSNQIISNADDMYFRVMSTNLISEFVYTKDETDTYFLWIQFPEVYKYQPDDYEGVLELIEIKVNARQKI